MSRHFIGLEEKDELNIFKPAVVDETIANYEYVRWPYSAPGGGTAVTDTSKICIPVNDLTSWHLFNKAFLEVKYTITKSNDTPLPADHSIIAVVSDVEPVAIASTVMNLVCWSEDNIRSLGTRTGFYCEEYGGDDPINSQFLTNDAAHRQAHTTASGINPTALVISELNLWVPQLLPDEGIRAKLEQQLIDRKKKTVVDNDLYVTQYNGAAGVARHHFLVSSNIRKPKHIFVVMQKNARHTQNHNKSIFDHMSMQTIRVTVNGRPVPETAYEPNFEVANESYVQLYNSYLEASFHCNDSESGSIVTFEDFKNLYPIFVFDCSFTKGDRAGFSYQTAANIFVEYMIVDTVAHTAYVVVEAEAELDFKGDKEHLRITECRQ
ncbi:hypothetical protein QOT17_022437 [Balamuthia mandrillaris]